MILLLAVATLPALAQPGSVWIHGVPPVGYRLDGDLSEWESSKEMTAFEDVHIRQAPWGLLFAGKVPLRTPAGPKPRGTRVELSIIGPKPFRSPVPGWIDGFEDPTFPAVSGCQKQEEADREKCVAWYRAAREYQTQLARLFERRYRMSGRGATEIVATPAWNFIRNKFPSLEESDTGRPRWIKPAPVFNALQPAVMPRFQDSHRNGVYSFEIEVPWAALPPLDALTLEDFKFRLQIFDPEDGLVIAMPNWLLARMRAPRRYQLTNCGLRLTSESPDNQQWFRPGDDLVVRDVIRLQYPFTIMGAMGWQLEDAGLTPRVTVSRLDEEFIESGVWLCGPAPALSWHGYLTTNQAREGKLEIARKQRLPDGRWLIVSEERWRPYRPSHWKLRGVPDIERRCLAVGPWRY